MTDEKKPDSEDLIVALTLAENEIKHAKSMACSAHIAGRIGHDAAVKKDTERAMESIDRAMGHLRNVNPRSLDEMLEGIVNQPPVPRPDLGGVKPEKSKTEGGVRLGGEKPRFGG